MPQSLELYMRLCKAAVPIKVDIDPSIKTFFEGQNISGKDLLDNLIKHFAAQEDAPTKEWLQVLRNEYFKEPKNHMDYIPALKQALEGILSLYLQKKSGKDIPIDIPNMIPQVDFKCLRGTINRMSNVIESITGSPEKQFMNDFFAIEARKLVEMGMVQAGNEVHTPVTLIYLLGFLTHEQAKDMDSLYRCSLNTPQQEVFRIRAEFYNQLQEKIKEDINERLGTTLQYIRATSPEGIEKFNELMGEFENKYGKGFSHFVSEDEYIINTANLNEYIETTYPIPNFIEYNTLIEATTETLAALPLLEKLSILIILRNTGYSNIGGNNAFLQNAIIDSITENEKLNFPPSFLDKIKKRDLPAELSLAELIIYGAPFTSILEELQKTGSSLNITTNRQEAADNIPNIKHIAHGIATRENGTEIYNSIIGKIPADRKVAFDNALLVSAILNNNKKLIDSFLDRDDFNHEILLFSAEGSCSPLSLMVNCNSESLEKLLNKIAGLEDEQRLEILNHVDKDGNTPLCIAIQKGNNKTVQLLLTSGAEVNQASKNGFTALHIAAQNGHAEIVKELLSAEGRDVNAVDNSGRTALHMAAQNGHTEIVQLLLANGAAVDQANKDDVTALLIAAKNGHAEIVQLLLAKGAAVDQATKNGFTALHIATQNGHAEIVQLLLAKGAAVDQATKKGFTALHIAAQNGHAEIVKLLLLNGAKVDHGNKNGFTALHIAAQNGHVDVVKELLASNANILIQAGEDLLTALNEACDSGHKEIVQLLLDGYAKVDPDNKDGLIDLADKDGFTVLHIAAYGGHTDVVKLLIDRGANVDQANKDDATALLIAAQNGHVDVVKELLASGAKVDHAKKDGFPALHIAAQNGHAEIVQLLLAKGAAVDQATKKGVTALHIAAWNGYAEIVKELLSAEGRDVNAVDNSGRTALHMAAQNGHVDVVKELLSTEGIDVNAVDNSGRTPLDMAKDPEIIALLESHIKSDKNPSPGSSGQSWGERYQHSSSRHEEGPGL